MQRVEEDFTPGRVEATLNLSRRQGAAARKLRFEPPPDVRSSQLMRQRVIIQDGRQILESFRAIPDGLDLAPHTTTVRFL
jgi:hypothetical protein